MTERTLVRVGSAIAATAALVTIVRCLGATHSGVWFTFAASLAVIAGAAAAWRGWTWGLVLCVAAGTSFAAATALGIAPPWFLLVAAAACLPAIAASRTLARFDALAALAAAALASALGTAGAFAVRE